MSDASNFRCPSLSESLVERHKASRHLYLLAHYWYSSSDIHFLLSVSASHWDLSPVILCKLTPSLPYYCCFPLPPCQLLQSCLTLCNSMDCDPPGSSAHGDSPSKNTGVGCHTLFQGTFLTQGSKLCLFMSPALAGRFFTTSTTWEAPGVLSHSYCLNLSPL